MGVHWPNADVPCQNADVPCPPHSGAGAPLWSPGRGTGERPVSQWTTRFHSGPRAGGRGGTGEAQGRRSGGQGRRVANRGAQWSERGEMSLARGRKSSPPGNLTRPSRRPRWASRGGSTPGESREADEMLREADEMLLRAREADHEMLREVGGDVACCGVPSERDAHAGNARFGGGGDSRRSRPTRRAPGFCTRSVLEGGSLLTLGDTTTGHACVHPAAAAGRAP